MPRTVRQHVVARRRNCRMPIVLFTGLCATSPADAGASHHIDICSRPDNRTALHFTYYDQARAAFDGSAAATNREDYGADLAIDAGGGWLLGAGYRGTALHVERLPLQTNGYLHTLFVPIHKTSQRGSSELRISAGPAVSTSSNVFNDPSQYSRDVFQLPVAFSWTRRLAPTRGISVGVCADRRFGRHRIYPTLLASWEVTDDWHLELGFPEAALRFAASDHVSLALRIEPNGHSWHVFDRNLTRESRVVYRALRIEAILEWRGGSHFSLSAMFGVDVRGRYEMTLADGMRSRFGTDSPQHVGVGVGWTF